MPKAIPLSEYASKRNKTKSIKALQVFRLQAKPKSSPIDIDLRALTEESAWGLSDRFRFWQVLRGTATPVGLTIRKLDLDEKALVRCRVEIDGALSILSNSEEYAKRFFRSVFVAGPPLFQHGNWRVKSGWTGNRTAVGFFTGMVDGALGWGPHIPHEVEGSLKEAFSSIQKRNWRSCVVMCRRALQALMEGAYAKFFGAKPGGQLDLNSIIRKFEALTPPRIPRHWLNIADSIRNLGNVPGAHPRPISGYRFSKQDAILAYENTICFRCCVFRENIHITIG